MTPEERQMLTDLAAKVAQTPPPQRDAEAEEFIRTRIGARPDALYLMTQTVLIQNLALDHARQEIEKLKQAPAPASGGAGFLGSQSYQAQPQSPPPASAMPVSGGGLSGFLRGAATTVAGVAAGALAFEGVRSLFGGGSEHLSSFGGGLHPSSSFLGSGTPETVINNYYEQSPEDSTESEDDADVTDSDDTDTDDSDDSVDDDSSSSDDDLV